MVKVGDLKVKLFADGADLAGMLEMYEKPYIKGLIRSRSFNAHQNKTNLF
jgi:hypothetical protein